MNTAPKRILVPLNLDANVGETIAFAEQEAARTGAELHFLHVIAADAFQRYVESGRNGEMTIYLPFMEPPKGSKLDLKIQGLLSDTHARVERAVDGTAAPYRTSVRHGNVVEEILREIESSRPDLVVMRTRGNTGIRHWMLGSVTEQVVRRSPVPVLTTRTQRAA